VGQGRDVISPQTSWDTHGTENPLQVSSFLRKIFSFHFVSRFGFREMTIEYQAGARYRTPLLSNTRADVGRAILAKEKEDYILHWYSIV
jgi:hypothetical protein